MRTKSRIWFGVGAFVVMGTGATGGGPLAETAPGAPALTAETALPRIHSGRIAVAQHADHPDQKKEPGEGNEAKGLANLPPELAFAVRIALIRGHLLVGDELVKQQQWNAALPHFLHPGEEIYGDIKDELADYKVPPFDATLKALADSVKAKKGGNDYTKALKAVNDALVAADAGMKAKQQANWPAGSPSRSNIRTRAASSGRATAWSRASPPTCRRRTRPPSMGSALD